MKTQNKVSSKIIRFWLGANYNQLFIIFFLIYFIGQIIRGLITNLFNL